MTNAAVVKDAAKAPSWSKRLLNIAGLGKRPKPVVAATPCDEVFKENKWRLLRYRPRAASPQTGHTSAGPAFKRPVLLVPSLINRHYVLDLMPGKSFAEWLVAKGHDVYVIDWGTPGPEDRFLTFDEIADKYIGRAVRKVSERSDDNDVHLLGYCLGGTLTTIYAAARPEKVASLVDIAAPVDFDDGGLLSEWTKRKEFDLAALLGAFGNVPWPLMQATFHMLRPTLNLSKGVYMLDRAWDDEFLDGFLALEAWGSDNVSFPGEAFRKYIGELYQKNALIKGGLTLSGDRVDLANIRCPLLNITFEHDNIVPKASASVLNELVSSKDKELLVLPGGHVGAVVSKSASKGLWPKISSFWSERDAAVDVAVPQSAPAEAPRKRAASAKPAPGPEVNASVTTPVTGAALPVLPAAPVVAPSSKRRRGARPATRR